MEKPSFNRATLPLAERNAAAADLIACRLRYQYKALGLKEWRLMVQAALAKMPEEQAALVKAALKAWAAK